MPNSQIAAILPVAEQLVIDVLLGSNFEGHAFSEEAKPETVFWRMGQHAAAALLEQHLSMLRKCADGDEKLFLITMRIGRDAANQAHLSAGLDESTTEVQQTYLDGYAEMLDSVVGLFD